MKAVKILLLIFLILWTEHLNAQEQTGKNAISYGIGYFGDFIQFLDPGFGDKPYGLEDNPKVLGKIYNGFAMSGNYERLLKTGFQYAANIYFGRTSYYYNDPLGLYWNEKKFDYYMIIEMSFSKDLIKNNKYAFLPVIAPFYRHLTMTDIDYRFGKQDSTYVIISVPTPSNIIMNDIGLSFGFDIRRIFKNMFFVGISFRSNLVFNIGFETFYMAPQLGVRF